MLTRPIQAGDGIVDSEGFHWVVDGVMTDSQTGDIVGVTSTSYGVREEFYNGTFRRETFGEFLTRPTGFGRWSWFQFAFVQTMALGAVSAGVATIDQHGWVVFILVAAVEFVIIRYMHRQYTGKTR